MVACAHTGRELRLGELRWIALHGRRLLDRLQVQRECAVGWARDVTRGRGGSAETRRIGGFALRVRPQVQHDHRP